MSTNCSEGKSPTRTGKQTALLNQVSSFSIHVFFTALVIWSALVLGVRAQGTEKTIALSPVELEKIRLIEVAHAARIYTEIAFSKQNQREMHKNLPLSEADFGEAIKGIKARFQACMESGFEARLKNAFDAQVLRKTMQSVRSVDVPEPEKAETVIPAFTATDAYCASRISVWLAGTIK